MKAILLVLFTLLAVSGALGAWRWAQERLDAPGPGAQARRVVIPPGAGLSGVVGELADAGVMRPGVDQTLFTLMVRRQGTAKRLQAGEYEIPPAASLRDLARILSAGTNVVRYRLTAPEGLRIDALLARLYDAKELAGGVSRAWGEGELLPETYSYRRGETRDAVAERMRAAMRKTLAELWKARAADLPIATPEEAVVLASIIEKETKRPEERARIAGVFVNRLRKGMRLQSDPTVLYGLERENGPLGRALRRRDLKVDHPWNTYTRKGLPPSPISSPGRAAIAAALNPMRTDDLYFVADGDGGHRFAKTLREHNRNVAKWRAARRRKR